MARETNISLLGKHAWDLLHNQDRLCVEVLTGKYLKSDHILNAKPVLGPSYIWSSILKSVEVLKNVVSNTELARSLFGTKNG